jgi:hypothetical protein
MLHTLYHYEFLSLGPGKGDTKSRPKVELPLVKDLVKLKSCEQGSSGSAIHVVSRLWSHGWRGLGVAQ